jgi:hypothetical protein
VVPDRRVADLSPLIMSEGSTYMGTMSSERGCRGLCASGLSSLPIARPCAQEIQTRRIRARHDVETKARLKILFTIGPGALLTNKFPATKVKFCWAAMMKSSNICTIRVKMASDATGWVVRQLLTSVEFRIREEVT